jgi:hypothetical protein
MTRAEDLVGRAGKGEMSWLPWRGRGPLPLHRRHCAVPLLELIRPDAVSCIDRGADTASPVGRSLPG